ncbi:PFAM short chain dehydrogenase [Cytospora paraplurivora]|uniref:PFAM short chain dehydrogenase n=1 Tax=Cytospora paraplurivora TaxID=2898453 RepID=A0AAN9U441_9PEZI
MASRLTLDGGIALVTGAASGIGKETVLAYAEAGAKGVVIADINLEAAQQVAEESKKVAKHSDYKVLAVKLDIGDEKSVQGLVTETVKEFGRIDYAVNSAGIDLEGYKSFTPYLDIDLFSKSVDVNIKGAVYFVKAVTSAIAQQEPLSFTGRYGTRSLGRGSIVLVGSVQSYIGAPGMISYTTGKHAILGIMKSAAIDSLALQSHIRVNAVCPGWVDTPMMQDGIKLNPIIGHAVSTMTPLKRAATPDEVADSIIFLSSPSASFINGVALPIDSGLLLPPPPPLPADYIA